MPSGQVTEKHNKYRFTSSKGLFRLFSQYGILEWRKGPEAARIFLLKKRVIKNIF